MSNTITIIIPTYNRAFLLAQIIKQINTTSDPPEEIIIVNDNSTDNTAVLVSSLQKKYPNLKYTLNDGRFQRDAKNTGLKIATGDYISFWDDDLILEDPGFFTKLRPLLKQSNVVQAKVILENLGQKNEAKTHISDHIAYRPYPILEFPTPHYQSGTKPRQIYPLIESCNFWHKSLAPQMIDRNLIGDAYGESYLSSFRLLKKKIKLTLYPQLTIRHPGANIGGSNRFNKKSMLNGFSEFHRAYFYNMTYAHSICWPKWIWLWLPYLGLKSIIALMFNKSFANWQKYAASPMASALKQHYGKTRI